MIDLEQIQQARERIAKVAKRTPLIVSETISADIGNQLFLKSEHLQKTGSFKIRGAANKVIFEKERNVKSVVAASSGNHGQAVAYIAKQLGIRAHVVLPENAAACKREAILAYQGNLEFCGKTSEERIERAKQICAEEQAVFIPPYDDPMIMAGQGTVGLEILEQLEDVEEVYVPIGGGGLISGVATAIKESRPSVRVIGVEPAMANDTYLSMREGKRIHRGIADTIADGLRTTMPGELTFPVVQRYVDEIVLVEEDAIKQAFMYVLTRTKQVIEPSGAVSVAAAMASGARGKRIVAVVSGGNVDTAVIPSLLV